MRKSLSLKPGDILAVRLEEDRVVLEPVPMEVYTEERIGTCSEDSRATPEAIASFRRGWGLERVRA